MNIKGDTPIKLVSINEMDDQTIMDHLQGIRDRRMRPIREYEEMIELKELARKEGLTTKYNQQMTIMGKDLARLVVNMEKVEIRAKKLRGLRLEIEE
jgi:urease accessory protein UreF